MANADKARHRLSRAGTAAQLRVATRVTQIRGDRQP